MPIYLIRYKILFMEKKNYNSLEGCKRHLQQSFAQKDKKFGEDGLWSCLKNGRK